MNANLKGFYEYLNDNYKSIEDNKDFINQIKEERENFLRLYPLETLYNLELEKYDKLDNTNSFMNLIENQTQGFGSGSLGKNSNKYFYQKKKILNTIFMMLEK